MPEDLADSDGAPGPQPKVEPVQKEPETPKEPLSPPPPRASLIEPPENGDGQ